MYDVAVLGYHAGRAQWPLARTYLPEVARSIAIASRPHSLPSDSPLHRDCKFVLEFAKFSFNLQNPSEI